MKVGALIPRPQAERTSSATTRLPLSVNTKMRRSQRLASPASPKTRDELFFVMNF